MPCCPQHLIFETLCIGHIVKTCVKGVSKFLLLNARVAKLRPINLQSQFCDTCSHTPFSAPHFSLESWAWTGPMQRIVQYARLAHHAATHEAFGVIQGPPIIMRSRIANPGHFKLGVPGLQPMLAQRGQVAERASDECVVVGYRPRRGLLEPLQTPVPLNSRASPGRDRTPPAQHPAPQPCSELN